MLSMSSALSQDEMMELDDLLQNKVYSNNSMPLNVLDGFLYALVVGPITLMPREWLTKVWETEGGAYPRVKNEDKLDRLLELVTRSFNRSHLRIREKSYAKPIATVVVA